MSGAVKLIGSVQRTTAEAGQKIIRGIASTANRDRHGETVAPKGITWRLPVPLLASHDHHVRALIGRVTELTATDTELRFVANVSTATPSARDIAALIDDGSLVGVSIGFLGLEHEVLPKGLHWKAAELLEISLVSVPSNRESRLVSTFGKSAETITPKHAPGAGAVRLLTAR